MGTRLTSTALDEEGVDDDGKERMGCDGGVDDDGKQRLGGDDGGGDEPLMVFWEAITEDMRVSWNCNS